MAESLKDANLLFALLKAIADTINGSVGELRGDHMKRLVEFYELTGSKSLDVKLDDGRKVATITLSISRDQVTVSDGEAFADWCEKNRPGTVKTEEIPAVTRKYVDPKRVEGILADFLPVPGAKEVTTEDGEIVPGVTFKAGGAPTSFSVKWAPDGQDFLVTGYRLGQFSELLEGSPLREIEP